MSFFYTLNFFVVCALLLLAWTVKIIRKHCIVYFLPDVKCFSICFAPNHVSYHSEGNTSRVSALIHDKIIRCLQISPVLVCCSVLFHFKLCCWGSVTQLCCHVHHRCCNGARDAVKVTNWVFKNFYALGKFKSIQAPLWKCLTAKSVCCQFFVCSQMELPLRFTT